VSRFKYERYNYNQWHIVTPVPVMPNIQQPHLGQLASLLARSARPLAQAPVNNNNHHSL
jgi:hypothetical protein